MRDRANIGIADHPLAASRQNSYDMAVISDYTDARQEQQQQQKIKPKKTVGSVLYVQKPPNGECLYTRIEDTQPNAATTSNMLNDERQLEILDIRTAGKDFCLRDNGFELHGLQVATDIDWSDETQVSPAARMDLIPVHMISKEVYIRPARTGSWKELTKLHSRRPWVHLQVREQYYPVVEALLKKVSGASRVHIFDATYRCGKLSARKGSTDRSARGQPQGSVHVDYNRTSGIKRLHELLPREAHKLQQTPFGIIQVWRPLKGPVRTAPLGLIDAATVKDEDLTPKFICRPDRTAQNFAVHYSPSHRWYYADGINTDEAYVFVCYDSRADRARFTPHAGFRDLSVGDDAPPRESVEVRAYVFWEDEVAYEDD